MEPQLIATLKELWAVLRTILSGRPAGNRDSPGAQVIRVHAPYGRDVHVVNHPNTLQADFHRAAPPARRNSDAFETLGREALAWAAGNPSLEALITERTDSRTIALRHRPMPVEPRRNQPTLVPVRKPTTRPATDQRGTVKWWNDAKGFGFITPSSGPPDLFVHSTGVICDEQWLVEGVGVIYTRLNGTKGPLAVNVDVEPVWPDDGA